MGVTSCQTRRVTRRRALFENKSSRLCLKYRPSLRFPPLLVLILVTLVDILIATTMLLASMLFFKSTILYNKSDGFLVSTADEI